MRTRPLACFLALSATLLASACLAPPPSEAAAGTLSLQAKGTPAGGVWPRVSVYADGVRIGGASITSTTLNWVSVPLTQSVSPGTKLDVFFDNDANSGSEDRNLHVAAASANGVTSTVGSSNWTIDRGTTYASATDGRDVLAGQKDVYWNAALRTTWPGTSTPAPSTPFSGKQQNGQSSKLFAADSFWYRQLPANAPLDPNSAGIVNEINKAALAAFQSDPWPKPPTVPTDAASVTIAYKNYSPGVFIARNSDPVATFTWTNCMGWPSFVGDQGLIAKQLTGIRVPANAVPAEGTDKEMAVYNADTGTYTEVWNATKTGPNSFRVCWGGTFTQTSTSKGVFPTPYGVTPSGLPMLPGLILPSELAAGEINHVVGVAVPLQLINSTVSSPGTRTNGRANGANTISQGQLMRLPANLDLASLKLSPTALTIAKAAQRYGIVVWDAGDNVTFRAQNINSLGGDPYPGLYGNWAYPMQGDTSKGQRPFPVDKLQVVARNYSAP